MDTDSDPSSILLLDANIPVAAADALRTAGHTVHDIREEAAPGIPDEDIATTARELQAMIVTRDFDFADILAYPPGSNPGIIVLKVQNLKRDAIISLVLSFLRSIPIQNLRHATTIVEFGRCRIRRATGETEERTFPIP